MVKQNTAGVVTFSFGTEGGRCAEVFLAGEFNKWDPKATRMPYLADKGIYEVTVDLPPGQHPYKFVIDDVWCPDPDNDRSASDGYGGLNSIVEV